MNRLDLQLLETDPGFGEVIRGVPLQNGSPLPPDWLRCEMLERYLVLRSAGIAAGSAVLEVGSGGHAISTVPVAYLLGSTGRVFAVELSRWGQFRTIVGASRMTDRIYPVAADARRLPFCDDSVDLALCIHGVRSLRSEENMVCVFREMLRVARRVVVAESLPIANTDAQRAHLAMYNLREEVFQAAIGSTDDLHYLSLDRLKSLTERAGGVVQESHTLEIDLPHALAYFPRSLVEAIPAEDRRTDLLRRWDEANALLALHGADHPPVGVVCAVRS